HHPVAADVNLLKLYPPPRNKQTLPTRRSPDQKQQETASLLIAQRQRRRCRRRQIPHRSVAADVSRLKLHPWPAGKGMLRKRSDPAHAGCYKSAWTSTGVSAEGAIGEN